MDRMKTFWNYFLLFVISYLIISGLIYLATKPADPKDNKYSVAFDEPKVTIAEAKSMEAGGYIEGSIKNTTDSIIPLKYIKFDFYDGEGYYLGTRYKALTNFNVGEKQNFKIEHKFKEVDSIKISLADEEAENEISKLKTYMEETWPLAALIALIYLL